MIIEILISGLGPSGSNTSFWEKNECKVANKKYWTTPRDYARNRFGSWIWWFVTTTLYEYDVFINLWIDFNESAQGHFKLFDKKKPRRVLSINFFMVDSYCSHLFCISVRECCSLRIFYTINVVLYSSINNCYQYNNQK